MAGNWMRNLPWPSAWHGVRRRFRLVFFVCPPIAILLAVVAVFLFRDGFELAFAVFGGSIAAAGAAAQAYWNANIDLRHGGVPVVVERGGSSRLWIQSHRRDVFFQHLVHAGGMLFGLGGFYAAVSGAFLEAEGRAARGGLYFLVLGLPIAGWMGARLFSRVVRRDSSLGLGVSPVGIHHTSWWGEVTYRWEYIDKVVPVGSTLKRDRPGFYLVRIVLNDRGKRWAAGGPIPGQAPRRWGIVRRKSAYIPVSRLDTYPTLVPALLSFYFEHPELRKELGTEAAVERVRAANFTPLS